MPLRSLGGSGSGTFGWMHCVYFQDDDDDKALEIHKMGTIYRNSTITIAASMATNSQEGFFRTEPEITEDSSRPGHRFEVEVPYSSVGDIIMYQGWRNITIVDTNPLDTRGWALQEYLLSPRILNFTKAQLLLDCYRDRNKQLWKTNT